MFSDIVMPGDDILTASASPVKSARAIPICRWCSTTGYSDAAEGKAADLKILRKPFDTAALRGFIADTMAVDLAS